MKCYSKLIFQLDELKDFEQLYNILITEDYDFNEEIQIEVIKQENCVEIEIKTNTPQQLKIGTTAVINSCDVYYKTLKVVKN